MTINITDLITAAYERADSASASAQTAAGQVLNNFYIPGGTPFQATVPALRGVPPAYTGNMNIIPDIKQAFEDAFADFEPILTDALAQYIADFFPETVRNATDNWIANTILYGGTGIPAHIQEAIYQRGRAQELAEVTRNESEVVNSFAARGFTLPSGAMAEQLRMVQQSASDKLSTMSRDIAIKSVEIEIENIKFAVQQGVSLRIGVLAALGAYLKAYSTPIELAMEKSKIIGDAQQKLWSSSADYYRAMISEAEMGLRAQEINARSHDGVIDSQNSALERFVNNRTQAALGVAQVLGNLAAGASNATVSLAGEETTRIGIASS